MSTAAINRLMAKTEKQGDCLVWTGGKSKTSGYGLAWANGKNQSAHRVSYAIHHGEIPAGLHVMHTCDNRLCINPAHLILGSRSDNMVDKEAKGRGNHVLGTSHPKAKATPEIAAEIRRRYQPRHPINGGSALAREFNLAQQTVSHILRGDTWAA